MEGGENAQNQANEATEANGHTNHQGEGSLSPELLLDPCRSESGDHTGTLISHKPASDCDDVAAGLFNNDSSDTEDS